MTDHRLPELERAFARSGEREDELALLRARTRLGVPDRPAAELRHRAQRRRAGARAIP